VTSGQFSLTIVQNKVPYKRRAAAEYGQANHIRTGLKCAVQGCETACAVIQRIPLRREPTTFGQSIRKARLEKGLRQKDFAEAIGVAETTAANWESYPTMPARGLAKVIAQLLDLGLAMDELVGRFRAHDGWRSPLVAARIARGLTQEEVAQVAARTTVQPLFLRDVCQRRNSYDSEK